MKGRRRARISRLSWLAYLDKLGFTPSNLPSSLTRKGESRSRSERLGLPFCMPASWLTPSIEGVEYAATLVRPPLDIGSAVQLARN